MSVMEESVNMSGNNMWEWIVERLKTWLKDKADVHQEHFVADRGECDCESDCMSVIYMRFNRT